MKNFGYESTKTMYAIEYAYKDGARSFDIFPTLKDAKKYVYDKRNWAKYCVPLFIFKADFSTKYIYYDEQFHFWNYDDCLQLIAGNYEVVKNLNEAPVSFVQ